MKVTLQITVEKDEGKRCDEGDILEALLDELYGFEFEVDSGDGETSLYTIREP